MAEGCVIIVTIFLYTELENSEGHWQKEGIDLHGIQAHHVRVLIDTGFDHFVAVNDIQIEGNAVHG